MSSVTDPSRTTSHIIKGISKILTEIIDENEASLTKNVKDRASKLHNPKSIFSCKTPPSISIEAYLGRILKYSKIEESTLIITLIYLDRVCDMHNLDLTNHNIHRYFLLILQNADLFCNGGY